jgi:hypothetical protein
VLICADAGIEGIYEELAADGVTAVILITAGGGSDSQGCHQAQLADPEARKRYLASALNYVSTEFVQRSLALELAQISCNQSGWDKAIGYFQCGGSSIIDRSGNVTAVIPPRLVFEHLRCELTVGDVRR